MQYLLAAALVVFLGAPSLDAQNTKDECKGHCQTNYGFCMNRAKTKKAKSSCKTDRKRCKGGCAALRQ